MWDDAASTGPSPRAGGRFGDVRSFDEVDSTNRVAATLARQGLLDVVVVADHQTAGRGRLGRRWVAPPGTSLLMSVVLAPPSPTTHAGLATIALALAASDGCHEVASVRPAIKWPNDLVAGEAKLGGILGETVLEAGQLAFVVGLGLNVNWTEEPPAGGTALNHVVGRDVDRKALLAAILEYLERRTEGLRDPEAAAALLADYRNRSATLGRRVRAELFAGALEGQAVDVTAEGHLVVEHGEGRRVIAAGDVVHLRPV